MGKGNKKTYHLGLCDTLTFKCICGYTFTSTNKRLFNRIEKIHCRRCTKYNNSNLPKQDQYIESNILRDTYGQKINLINSTLTQNIFS
jgi:hypothetical protein